VGESMFVARPDSLHAYDHRDWPKASVTGLWPACLPAYGQRGWTCGRADVGT